MHPKLRWLGLVFWVFLLLRSAIVAQDPSPTPIIPPVPRPTPVNPPSPTIPPTAIPSPAPPNPSPPPRSTPPFYIPAPNPAPTIARATPPAPGPITGRPSALYLQHLTPLIQVWWSDSLTPELPVRRGKYLSPVLIAPSETLIVRLQFGPQARGKSVIVRPGPGVTINPSQQVFVLPPTADCAMSVTLGQSFLRGAIHFYCEGLTTTLPLGRGVSKGPVQGGSR